MGESKKGQGRITSFNNRITKSSEEEVDDISIHTNRLDEYEKEMERLYGQVKALERELNELTQSKAQLDVVKHQNERLVAALNEAKRQIEVLKVEVEKLTKPPSTYGIFSYANKDGTIDIYINGRKMKVNVHPDIRIEDMKKGQQLILNEALNVVEVCDYEKQGEVVRLKDLLDDKRAMVTLRADEEKVAELADLLSEKTLSVGDNLLYDSKSGYLLEKLPKSEIEEVVLEEVPDVSYSDIGGLDSQIETVKDAIELPSLYPDLFAEHKLPPPKGVLLYGPPGCGKTLIAKAVANSIAKRKGNRTGKDVRSYFLHVKGPELLNKYVGESERQIREVFKKAKEKAIGDIPVIVFFDEMDALFRTRGTGVSSDMESTIVPQFLSEIDGVEGLVNVIVIGASNRQDLIDPAILRPGRLDIRIKIDRPTKEASKDIFSKYLDEELPYHKDELSKVDGDKKRLIRQFIDNIVEELFKICDENKFLEVTYVSGEKETFYFKDFVSGAMINGIVSRAKKYAIKRMIATNEKGIKCDDLIRGLKDEFKENEDLPNTTNPDDWAKIAGRKGEKIIQVRTVGGRDRNARKIETLTPGHYL
ncbi:MAG: proteasome ATPase [Nitrospirota bacterium]